MRENLYEGLILSNFKGKGKGKSKKIDQMFHFLASSPKEVIRAM